jgi:hypothetical protein
MTAMKLLILTWVVASAGAFQPATRRQGTSHLMTLYGKKKIDERKIKDAAAHFGKYSVKEIEEMKEGTYLIGCLRDRENRSVILLAHFYPLLFILCMHLRTPQGTHSIAHV